MTEERKEAKIRQNLHTHSIYDDGKDSIEEMVLTAIDKGFTVLGFSGHSFNQPLDDGSMNLENTEKYIRDVKEAKEKYADRIQIVLGIEKDSLSEIEPERYDYVIGSLHYLKNDGECVPVDYSREEFKRILNDLYKGDIRQMVSDYCVQLEKMVDDGGFDILGHIDLITKYNESEEYFAFGAPWYLQKMESIVQKAAQAGIIFEMNSGAVSRGYRSEAYPDERILKMIRKHDGRLCINTDCHSRDNLDCQMRECLRRAEKACFERLAAWDDAQKKFTDLPLVCFE